MVSILCYWRSEQAYDVTGIDYAYNRTNGNAVLKQLYLDAAAIMLSQRWKPNREALYRTRLSLRHQQFHQMIDLRCQLSLVCELARLILFFQILPTF